MQKDLSSVCCWCMSYCILYILIHYIALSHICFGRAMDQKCPLSSQEIHFAHKLLGFARHCCVKRYIVCSFWMLIKKHSWMQVCSREANWRVPRNRNAIYRKCPLHCLLRSAKQTIRGYHKSRAQAYLVDWETIYTLGWFKPRLGPECMILKQIFEDFEDCWRIVYLLPTKCEIGLLLLEVPAQHSQSRPSRDSSLLASMPYRPNFNAKPIAASTPPWAPSSCFGQFVK